MRICNPLFFLLIIAVSACGGGGGESSVDGAELYAQPIASGNTFACATCHALSEPASDGLRRPGHPIGDAIRRATFKNGQLTDLREAVNTCLDEWMAANTWTADDARWIALRDYLEAQAPAGMADPITIQRVDPPADLSGGDPTAGRTTFNQTCMVCHGPDAVGTERAPSLVGFPRSRELIASRIRTSGATNSSVYPGLTGGVMPFWGLDRLSDAELLDVVAYVEEVGTQDVSDAGVGTDGDTPDADVNCGTDHPKVGQTAALSTFAHNVSGTATIINNCQVRIDNFFFDGGGIDVRIYGGTGTGNIDYRPPVGFPMSDNLLSMPYNGGTLLVDIPAGKLDDLDGISVWCVAARVSFGDGAFQ